MIDVDRKALAAKVEEIRARVENTICQTWSSDTGDVSEQGRISREDFDVLVLAALPVAEPVAFKNGPVRLGYEASLHLNWIADRLEHVHGENPNYDYMHRLREIANAIKAAPIASSAPQPEGADTHKHAAEFTAKMCWRTDPPNAVNKLTDSERLSAIKYHPTIKELGKPHRELALSETTPAPREALAVSDEMVERLREAIGQPVTYNGRLSSSTCRAALEAALSTSRAESVKVEDAVKHMVSRFLTWKLPEHFNPDCGISFNESYRSEHGPVGTNLFDAMQAEAMVRHMVEGLSALSTPRAEKGT